MPRLRATVTIEQRKKLAARLREEREERALSQSDVATQIRKSKALISQLEGANGNPSADVLAALEDFYHIEPGTLFKIVGDDRFLEGESASAMHAHERRTFEEYVLVREGLLTNTLESKIWGTDTIIQICDTWIGQDLASLEDAFLNAVLRGVSVQFLLSEPNTARVRGQKLGLTPTQTQYGLELATENLGTLATWYQKWTSNWGDLLQMRAHAEQRETTHAAEMPLRFVVRINPDQPPVQYYRFDNTAFIGFFLHLMESRFRPQLEVDIYQYDRDGGPRTTLGKTFTDEFEAIWSSTGVTEYDLTRKQC